MKNIGGILLAVILIYFFWYTVNHQQAVDVTNALDTTDNNLVFLVGPELKTCVGEAPMSCMVVNGELFYDEIEGFRYEEGNYYVILVEKTTLENAPQDASIYQYKLEKEFVKVPADQYKN